MDKGRSRKGKEDSGKFKTINKYMLPGENKCFQHKGKNKLSTFTVLSF